MNQEQAEAFVRNWYRIVETGVAKNKEQGRKHGELRAEPEASCC
jgi:hypothetical protein